MILFYWYHLLIKSRHMLSNLSSYLSQGLVFSNAAEMTIHLTMIKLIYWQSDGKRCPFTYFAFYVNRTIMVLDNFLCNCQADPTSTVQAIFNILFSLTIKSIKNMR